MELLHVYSASDGTELFTRDLSGETRPFIVSTRPDGTIEFAVNATPGNAVIGALVRNEDGWSLASASVSTPVTCGPKSAPDMQLMAGMACAIGGFTFRLENDEVASGCVLIWRYEGSKPVMDAVVAGRNSVGRTPGAEGRVAVNPPLMEQPLFEFFPSLDGIDVVFGSGDSRLRLQVPAGTLFACSGFEGMYLDAAHGAKAMESSNPFSWPSRRPRRQLVLGVMAMLSVFVVAAALHFRLDMLNKRIAEPRGATRFEIEEGYFAFQNDLRDDVAMVMMYYLRSLPMLLTASASQVSLDLINVSEQPRFADCETVQRMLGFVKSIRNIQECIGSLRWGDLETAINGVDREYCMMSEADSFLEDAREVCDGANHAVPEFFLKISEVGSKDFEAFTNYVSTTGGSFLPEDNIFAASESFKREIDLGRERWETLVGYVVSRDRLIDGGDYDSREVTQLIEAYTLMRDLYQGTPYEPVAEREKGVMLALCDQLVEIAEKAQEKNPEGFELTKLGLVATLGEQVGASEEKVASWREAARAAGKRLDSRYRQLYQNYRLKVGSHPELARGLLTEMIELGGVSNPFYNWALREFDRLNKAEEERISKAKAAEEGK